jgi:hypothetical protein
MNSGKYKRILGGLVSSTVESGHPAAPDIIQKISDHIRGLTDETVDPSSELASLICSLVSSEKSAADAADGKAKIWKPGEVG